MDISKISQELQIYKNEKNNEPSELQKIGKEELKNNDFFFFLDKLMTHPELRGYINKYFNEWSDIETTIMFIKLYQSIENEFKNSNCIIQNEEIIAILKVLITNTHYRKEIISEMRRYQGFDNKKNCLEYVNSELKRIKKG